MEVEHRGLALVVLGVTSVIAIVGLVLMFSGAQNSTGALFTNTGITKGLAACDSPCTLFPSGNDHDALMMEQRLLNRGWVYVGDVAFTYAFGAPEARKETLGCWCPQEGNPAFPPTEEFAALISGESTGASANSARNSPVLGRA